MTSLLLLSLLGCNADPLADATSAELDGLQTVDYRDGTDGPTSGERGTLKISEIFWSGSVEGTGDDAVWRKEDVFLELRNEGNRPINLSRWQLQVEGDVLRTFLIPDNDVVLEVGAQLTIATTRAHCFPHAELLIPEMELPYDAAFQVTLYDADERLMEPAGSETSLPYAGGYDLVTSRSMERIQLMFGGQGAEPQSWHHYNRKPCPAGVTDPEGDGTLLSCFQNIPNHDRVKPSCRRHTQASPSRPNSPDYSGAFANGGFE